MRSSVTQPWHLASMDRTQRLVHNPSYICCRKARLVETWMLMEYCERGSLADALRTGRLRRPHGTGLPDLAALVACLLDIAQGACCT